MTDGGGGSGSSSRVPGIDLSGLLNTSTVVSPDTSVIAGFGMASPIEDTTDSSAAFNDLPRNIRNMNRSKFSKMSCCECFYWV